MTYGYSGCRDRELFYRKAVKQLKFSYQETSDNPGTIIRIKVTTEGLIRDKRFKKSFTERNSDQEWKSGPERPKA